MDNPFYKLLLADDIALEINYKYQGEMMVDCPRGKYTIPSACGFRHKYSSYLPSFEGLLPLPKDPQERTFIERLVRFPSDEGSLCQKGLYPEAPGDLFSINKDFLETTFLNGTTIDSGTLLHTLCDELCRKHLTSGPQGVRFSIKSAGGFLLGVLPFCDGFKFWGLTGPDELSAMFNRHILLQIPSYALICRALPVVPS